MFSMSSMLVTPNLSLFCFLKINSFRALGGDACSDTRAHTFFCVPSPDRSRHGTIGMHAAHTNKSKYYGPREAGGVRVGERKAVGRRMRARVTPISCVAAWLAVYWLLQLQRSSPLPVLH